MWLWPPLLSDLGTQGGFLWVTGGHRVFSWDLAEAPHFRKLCGPITGARSRGILSGLAIYLRLHLGIVSVCARVCLRVSRAARVCMRVRTECCSFTSSCTWTQPSICF